MQIQDDFSLGLMSVFDAGIKEKQQATDQKICFCMILKMQEFKDSLTTIKKDLSNTYHLVNGLLNDENKKKLL